MMSVIISFVEEILLPGLAHQNMEYTLAPEHVDCSWAYCPTRETNETIMSDTTLSPDVLDADPTTRDFHTVDYDPDISVANAHDAGLAAGAQAAIDDAESLLPRADWPALEGIRADAAGLEAGVEQDIADEAGVHLGDEGDMDGVIDLGQFESGMQAALGDDSGDSPYNAETPQERQLDEAVEEMILEMEADDADDDDND